MGVLGASEVWAVGFAVHAVFESSDWFDEAASDLHCNPEGVDTILLLLV